VFSRPEFCSDIMLDTRDGAWHAAHKARPDRVVDRNAQSSDTRNPQPRRPTPVYRS